MFQSTPFESYKNKVDCQKLGEFYVIAQWLNHVTKANKENRLRCFILFGWSQSLSPFVWERHRFCVSKNAVFGNADSKSRDRGSKQLPKSKFLNRSINLKFQFQPLF